MQEEEAKGEAAEEGEEKTKKKTTMIKGKMKKKKKKIQARVVEACVESCLLFDCQVRVWQVREIKKLQSMVDRYYRWVCSRKTMPPLIQMQKEGKNMADVSKELGVRSMKWKIEKRILERIEHVMRMGYERMTKVAVLGWLAELERWPKLKGGRRRTIFYWKKLLREAGIDFTNLKALTEDRKKWKKIVRERMEHLDKWERSKGHKWTGEEVERNEVSAGKKMFECGKGCGDWRDF